MPFVSFRYGMPLLLLLAALAGCAGRADSFAIPPQNVSGSRAPVQGLPASLAVPSGAGPFPAVIVLHGCGGRSGAQQVWAERLNHWGYAAVVLDSFAPRGVSSVCDPANQARVTAQDRAGDVLSAAVWLRTRPEIDGARIGVIGFSHGGATAAWVTQRRYDRLFPGLLKASVDYYGVCRFPETQGGVPLLALAGEADDWGYPALSCRGFAAKLHAGQVFEVYTYPGVVHGFENVLQQHRSMVEGHALEYDRDAADDSFVRVKAFLDRYVGRSES
jgi:dienelactone hydrolase